MSKDMPKIRFDDGSEDIGLLASDNDTSLYNDNFGSAAASPRPGSPAVTQPRRNGAARTRSSPAEFKETSIDDAAHEAKVSQWRKISFAIGGFPSMVTHTVVGFFLSAFLLEIAVVSPAVVSVCTFAGRAWDAVMDPVVGHIASRTRTRFGSLRPWIAISLLPCVLTYFALWIVPDIGTAGKAGYYLALYLAFQTCFSFYQVPYTSLTMHVSLNPRERDVATTYRLVVETLGLMVGSIFQGFIIAELGDNGGTGGCKNCTAPDPSLLEDDLATSTMFSTPLDMFDAEPTSHTTLHGIFGDNATQRAYVIAAGIIGALCLVAGVILVTGVTENVAMSNKAPKKSFFKNLKFALSQKTYLLLIFMFLWAWMASQVNQANFILWMKYGFAREDQFQNLMVTLLVGNTLFLPVWFVVIQLIGKSRALAAGLCVNIPLNIVMYNLPPDTPTWGLHLQLGAASIGLGAVYLAPWAMLPDVIDDVQVKTGQRADSVFYSFFVFFQKFGAGIAIGLSVLALQFAGYKSPLCCGESQPPEVRDSLRILSSMVPLVLNFTSLVITAFYPLSREVCVKNKIILAERRKEAQSRQENYEAYARREGVDGQDDAMALDEARYSDGDEEDFSYLKAESEI